MTFSELGKPASFNSSFYVLFIKTDKCAVVDSITNNLSKNHLVDKVTPMHCSIYYRNSLPFSVICIFAFWRTSRPYCEYQATSYGISLAGRLEVAILLTSVMHVVPCVFKLRAKPSGQF